MHNYAGLKTDNLFLTFIVDLTFCPVNKHQKNAV